MGSLQHNSGPGQTVSESVIEAVADAEDVSPSTVSPPLYEVIDPDALDALFRSSATPAGPSRVEFTYAGYTVVVRDDGEIRVLDEP